MFQSPPSSCLHGWSCTSGDDELVSRAGVKGHLPVQHLGSSSIVQDGLPLQMASVHLRYGKELLDELWFMDAYSRYFKLVDKIETSTYIWSAPFCIADYPTYMIWDKWMSLG